MNLDIDKENLISKIGSKNIITVILVFVMIGLGIFYYFKTDNKNITPSNAEKVVENIKSHQGNISKIAVDIEGEVANPGLYYLTKDERVHNVIIAAGGFTKDVDFKYVSQDLNKAQKISDGMKIYIPSINDVVDLVQNKETIPLADKGSKDTEQINVNTASNSILDELPGIGESTVKKIVENRPYETIDKLLEKKVLTKSQFEKVKDQIVT